ncbi:MAG TPA: NAD(P)-binding domain-containing protein, partial [Nitriliruptoraceae bacterium]|nr:NAD(P)-binding domain-containing protein [Nitriliruptoraceae bacterium]
MTSADIRESLGIIGGTGPQGRGLAARWARAGHVVHIGSRTLEKAQAAVEDVQERVGDGPDVRAGTNADVAAAAEIIVVAVPYEAQVATLPSLADAIGDKVVCNVVNPMVFDERGPKAVRVDAGSAAEECQELLPRARVVSSFHDVSSRRLLRVDE